jgi:DNA-binding LytR/AlgR family response regulator
MRIAICDDGAAARAMLREAVERNAALPRGAVVVECPEGAALVNSHAECPFDIVFLDIQMEGMSGLEAGQKIRGADKKAIIIFLTSFPQYVFQSFEIETFDYIVKPAEGRRVDEVLDRALKKYREQHNVIEIRWRDVLRVLDVGEIVYVEARRRHIVFVTKGQRHECAGKFSEYEKRLSPYGFVECYHRVLINVGYIRSVESTHITTLYGQTVAMSVRKRQECLKAFSAFHAKHRV